MDEYKTIPQAPDYKISRNEEVIRSSNGKPLLTLAGGKVLLKKPDGTMQSFMTADLVKELFGDEDTKGRLRSQVVDLVSDNKVIVQSETNPAGDLTGPITYVKPTAEEQKAMEKEESNTNESEDGNLVKDSPAEIAERKDIDSKSRKKDKKNKAKNPKTEIDTSMKARAKKNNDLVAICSPYVETQKISDILKLDCSESIKLWKLHQLGCSTDEILYHLKQPGKKAHSFNSIIWRYKQNKKLRDRADLK